MREYRENVLVGMATGLFPTPFVGGGVAGYLNGPDTRDGIVSGGVVGAGILLLMIYEAQQTLAAVYSTAGSGPEVGSPQWVEALVIPLVGTFLLSIGAGLIGGVVGSYVAGKRRLTDA